MRQNFSAALLALLFCAFCRLGFAEGAAQDPVFRFSGGEQITVQCFDEGIAGGQAAPQLVTIDGFISIPAAGTVNIKSMTLEEATNAVVEKLKNAVKLKAPQASICLTSLPFHMIYVQGAVKSPQQLPLPAKHHLYLASALAAVGGTLPDADLTRIQIIHVEHAPGAKSEDFMDMSSAAGGKMPLGPMLSESDIVVVPLAETFYVVGEVNKAGMFSRGDSRVESGQPLRLSDALNVAGGAKSSADLHAIRILRRTPQEDSLKVLTFNLESAMDEGLSSEDPVLQSGDRIIVNANDGYMLLGRVKHPGIYYSPGVAGTHLTVSRLIAMAGGFEAYAKKSAVSIMRKGQPKAQTKVDVKAIMENGEMDKDVQLLPGDIVFVGESIL
jgi:protein involved in polysaccharide export with SLBB domain